MFKKLWDSLMWIFIISEVMLMILFFGPSLFNIKPFVVTSGSMVPKYPIGSLIYVRHAKPIDIKNGDTITFYMKNSLIVATHEVYKIDYKNKTFYTQGINNKNSDGSIIHDAEPIPFQNLIGRPILCIPYLGYVNMFMSKKPVALILIIITIIAIVISYLLDNGRSKKNEKG